MKPGNRFSVLIAEDEPIILDNICKKVIKSAPDLQIAGKAQSGNEALKILDETTVDILITDIEMPGMSGLELIRNVRDRFPQVKIVILSGYNNFEYARTALRYGVDDYLLKPLEQQTLDELLHALCIRIEDERTQHRREILSLALHDAEQLEAPPYMFRGSSFLLFHLTLGNLPADPDENILFSNRSLCRLWDTLDFEVCFHGVAEAQRLWIIGETCPLQKFLILNINGDGTSAEYIVLLLKKYLCRILGDRPFQLFGYAHAISYEAFGQTARILRAAVKDGARPFAQTVQIVSDPDTFSMQQADTLLKDLELLFSFQTETQFLQYIRQTLPQSFSCPTAVLYRCLWFIFDAFSRIYQIDEQSCHCAASALCSQLPSMAKAEQCLSALEEALQELWNTSASHISNRTLGSRIVQYMELHLQQQISLADLSDQFGYTPSYINRIFKKEYAVSPLQYLTSMRITQAKELLRKNPDLNIKIAARSVGYEDARYFSRIFKNETGVTPTGWVEALHKQNGKEV